MFLYDVKSLLEINPSYCENGRLFIDEEEVDLANYYVNLIEGSRSTETPKPGDMVVFTNEYGEYYPHAHLEYTTEERYGGNVCSNGSCAFVYPNTNKDGIVCQGSGGPWTSLPIDEFVYVGREMKRFWTWGTMGVGAHRGIYFDARVSVWFYDNPKLKDKKHTTQYYDKVYIYRNQKNDKIICSYGESGYSRCFEIEDDFKAYVKTYRGECTGKGGAFGFNDVYWFWKEKKHSKLTPQEYDDLPYPEDTFKMNGSVRKCKRRYDEENKTVHTYYVWYWGDDINDCMRQNEIRKAKYELPWDTKEYILARKELGI